MIYMWWEVAWDLALCICRSWVQSLETVFIKNISVRRNFVNVERYTT